MKFQKLTTPFYANCIFIIIPLLFIIGLRIVGFDGLYGQDSYEYLRYTEAIQGFFKNGILPGSYYWPVLYPFLGSILAFLCNDSAFGLQLLSCLSLSVSCIYLLKTLKLLYPKNTYRFLYVFLFGLFCPYFLKMGLIVMSDATSGMFVVLSVYFFFKTYYKKTSLAPIFVFATCAFMTRYASLFITFPIILYALYLVIQRKAISHLVLATVLSLVVCVPFILFQWNALFEVSNNYFLHAWSPSYFFKSNYTTTDGTQVYRFPNLIYTIYVFLHPGFIFIGFILSAIAVKNYKHYFSFPQKTLITCILLYILFLAGIPFQNPRILGLVSPLVLLFLFPAFLKCISFSFIKKHLFIVGILVLSVQLVLWSFTFKSIYYRVLLEKEIVNLVAPYQGETLYSFDVDLALQGRGMDFYYKNMFLERYSEFKKGEFVLFNPTQYSVQWKDKNPMINWNNLKYNYNLKLVTESTKGWKLYKIE